MEIIKFDLSKEGGKFKLLNATNGGPWYKRHADDQFRSNRDAYKAARIPYSRNHDSGACGVYGGPYSHDISKIFPDFDADPTDPASYDFACTDEDILKCLEVGTKTFFRLGQTLENQIKKHNIFPPKDFKKWAVICEHIIRHYTEGWADGFELDMPYWEIWNEPDLDVDNCPSPRAWGGTRAQFFDFFEVASNHLKACFPHLKIGGPALSGAEAWAEDFISTMQKRGVELDFFSWHNYNTDPKAMMAKGERIKAMLVKHGYDKTESIYNEWNYVKGWREDFVYSIECIHGLKGAAYIMSTICEAQKSSIDMLMYYDTRPSVFNGVFDFYNVRPLKGYYPLYWYGKFYDMKCEIRAESQPDDIYTLCGIDENGKTLTVVTYYTDNDNAENKEVKLDFGKKGKWEIYLLDKDKDATLVKTTGDLTFDMAIYSSILIKEI